LKIIYNCFGGSHSSVTAAAIHLRILPGDKTPRDSELLSLPYFDAQVAPDHGRLRFVGIDEFGNEIYVAGKRNLGTGYEMIMRSFLRIAGINDQEVIFIDTMPYVNAWMVIGGFLSRQCGLNKVGRKIVLYGTRRAYYRFIILVGRVKQRLLKEAGRLCENNIS
jgi:hypothetical protein